MKKLIPAPQCKAKKGVWWDEERKAWAPPRLKNKKGRKTK
jgi:hypothetical protein